MNETKEIPYIVYEGTMARMERTVKRLIWVVVLLVVLLFASNAIWLYEWNQYEYTEVVVDSKDGGNANYLAAGADGVINNGEGSSQKASEEEGQS